MNIQDNLKRGTIEMVLLTLLSQADKYGYQLAQDLEQQSCGKYQLSEATMYPTLYRLKKNGYLEDYKVVVVGKRSRVYYHITDTGKQYLHNIRTEYKRITNAIDLILDRYPEEIK